MKDLPIPPALARSLDARGYSELTDVQSAVLRPDAVGRDLIVSARTGSGKTVAYGLAMAESLLDADGKLNRADEPLALIVAPTRELALQVQRELEWLYAEAGARIVACVGGMDPRRERRILESGPHIVVGTPGRLCDHIRRNALKLSSLAVIVLDEADEMLDLGFREDLEFILGKTPGERRTFLFSATLPKGIVTLATKYQRRALRIEASLGETGHVDIEYRVYRVLAEEISLAVVNILRHSDVESAIIFCNTREAVRRLQALLVERGFSAVFLSGELSQHERNQALQALRDGRVRICVATDVAARGIDLPNLGLVIHAELPTNSEVLQHRSGRTGRAGRKGISALLVAPSRRRRAELLLSDGKIAAQWMSPPSVEDIRKQDAARFLADPMITDEASDEDRALGALILAKQSPEDIAAALARLYRARLPAPEDLVVVGSGSDKAVRQPREEGMRDNRKRPEGDKPPHMQIGETVWFRLEIGRKNRADPKWILPMLCRRGRIERAEIGSIRIEEDYSHFQIARDSAESFAVNVRVKDADDIRIERIGETLPASTDRVPRKFRTRSGEDKRAEFGKPDFKPRMPDAEVQEPRVQEPRAQEFRPQEPRVQEFRAPEPRGKDFSPKPREFAKPYPPGASPGKGRDAHPGKPRDQAKPYDPLKSGDHTRPYGEKKRWGPQPPQSEAKPFERSSARANAPERTDEPRGKPNPTAPRPWTAGPTRKKKPKPPRG